jgi:hypothetical protein
VITWCSKKRPFELISAFLMEGMNIPGLHRL